MALDAVEYRTALAWVVAMQSYAMTSYRYGGQPLQRYHVGGDTQVLLQT